MNRCPLREDKHVKRACALFSWMNERYTGEVKKEGEGQGESIRLLTQQVIGFGAARQ